MIKTIIKALTLAAVALGITACAGNYVDTLDKIKTRDQIIIGVKIDYPPFGFVNSDGKLAGLEIDIARYIADEILGSKEKVKFVPVATSNRIQFLQQGEIDLIIATMRETEERRQVIDFSENYYASGTGVLTRKESPISSWDDLKGQKVCGIKLSFYNTALTEMGIKMVNFPTTEEAYEALQDRVCVGFAFDDTALAGKLQDPEWAKDWHQVLPPLFSTPWGMGVRKGDTQLLKALNDSILKMEAEGFIVEGEKKWNLPPTDYAQKRMKRAKRIQ